MGKGEIVRKTDRKKEDKERRDEVFSRMTHLGLRLVSILYT